MKYGRRCELNERHFPPFPAFTRNYYCSVQKGMRTSKPRREEKRLKEKLQPSSAMQAVLQCRTRLSCKSGRPRVRILPVTTIFICLVDDISSFSLSHYSALTKNIFITLCFYLVLGGSHLSGGQNKHDSGKVQEPWPYGGEHRRQV